MNQVLETQEQLRDAKHVEGLQFKCGDCQQVKPVQTSGGTGYGYMPGSNKPVCYDCCNKREIESLKDRSKPFVAYVGKGDSITTWTGAKLMTITRAWPCQLTRRSFTHGKNYLSIHAVDVHGGHWAGRGSEGIAIKLRPVKA